MSVVCKRLLLPYADLLVEPIHKRSRVDAHMSTAEDDAQSCHDIGITSGSCSALADCRRRPPEKEFEELFEDQPSDKRSRVGQGMEGPSSDVPPGEGDSPVNRWAEDLVRSLQGCPSVEEATQRCSRALGAFEVEVRQNAAREAEVEAAEGAETAQSLQHTKKVLMRAVHHLAQRCRAAESSTAEADSLREELEKSREAQRRLAHHNEMLQCHLRLHLDSCAR